MLRYLLRTAALLVVMSLIGAGLIGCTEVTTAPAPSESKPKAAQVANLQGRAENLRRYLKENFGGGYGQPPVSWYSRIKSVTFVDDDRLVVKTSLTLNDGAAVRSVATALRNYSDLPASVKVLASNGEVLVE
ncbi:MAG: hypothetical protein Q7W30_02955 [Coriobacteriia bacterium]|nr:hypothetical protein [Coriobacteriia bacterium]